MKAETRMLRLDAKDDKGCQHTTGARREASKRFSFTISRRNHSADTLISVLRLPRLWDNKFLLFKTLSLWYFVRGALENKHNLLIGLNDALSFQDTAERAWCPALLVDGLCFTVWWGPLHFLQPWGFLVKKRMPILSYLLNSTVTQSATNHESPRVKTWELSLISPLSPPHLVSQVLSFLPPPCLSNLSFPFHGWGRHPCRLQLSLVQTVPTAI